MQESLQFSCPLPSRAREPTIEHPVELDMHCGQQEYRPAGERRRDPRVKTDLTAVLETADRRLNARVENLSMSGALLRFDEYGRLLRLYSGTRVKLSIVSQSVPEALTIEAKVVRVVYCKMFYKIGVQFVNADENTKLRIEGVLLQILSQPSE